MFSAVTVTESKSQLHDHAEFLFPSHKVLLQYWKGPGCVYFIQAIH